MLFLLELKKLFIKQHVLVLIILATAVKLFNSSGLFTPDYSVLTKNQRNFYLNYIALYGGKLTDEKEDAILDLYERASEANALRRKIEADYYAGRYESEKEYMEDFYNVDKIAGEYDAIKYLYQKYLIAAADKEHRWLLAGDAKAMTVGSENLLVLLICFMSAAAVFYERKMGRLVKTTISAGGSAAMRSAVLFLAIFSAWLIFAGIEFAAVVNSVGADYLGVSVANLDSFLNTPYTNLSILQAFVLIQLTKLCGYLFLSSVAVILELVVKNLPLAVLVPFSCTFVWIYLFRFSENATYYSPFSLILGSPYYTGDFYQHENGLDILLYTAVPLSQTLLLVGICILTTVVAVLVMIGKGRGARKLSAAFAALSVCLLCGCSWNAADDGVYKHHYGNIVFDGEYYYTLSDTTDEYGTVLERNLTVFDGEMKIVHKEINRRVTEEAWCEDIQLSGDYLYCRKEFRIGGELFTRITRINLKDFHEETVYTQPKQSQVAAYLDLVTVWINQQDLVGITNHWFVCGEELYIFTNNNKAYSVRNGRLKYLFEDMLIKDPARKNGKIYYLNASGYPVCYDGKKKIMSERSFYGADALADGYYCYNDSGIYRLDYDDFSIEKYCENPQNILRLYDDGILRWNDDGNYEFVDKSGNKRVYNMNANEYNYAFIDGAIFVCKDGTLERRDYRTNEKP